MHLIIRLIKLIIFIPIDDIFFYFLTQKFLKAKCMNSENE